MEELVSVIMPVYNDKIEYLIKAVKSILNQTYSQIELIIVDSSSDAEIRQEILKLQDTRIRYYFKEKNGVADALNFALDLTQGKYVARMDADDISLPDRLSMQVTFLKLHMDIGVVGCSFYRINDRDEVIENRLLPIDHDAIAANMIFENPICHPSVMFRREILEAGWRYNEVVAEDYDLWTRMIPEIKFANLQEKLVLYRKYESNLSRTNADNVAKSDVCSTMQFLPQLFHVDVSGYSEENFTKNYRVEKLKNAIRAEKENYLINQISLMYQIYCKNRELHIIEEKNLSQEFGKRLILLMELSDCISPGAYKIYTILRQKMGNQDFKMESICSEWGYGIGDSQKFMHKITTELRENRVFLQNFMQQNKSFLIYGLGQQGKETLTRCEELTRAGCFNWRLEGIVDQKEQEFVYLNERHTTISKEKIADAEYEIIMIASRHYYEQMKEILLECGVEEEKIVSDSWLYYV